MKKIYKCVLSLLILLAITTATIEAQGAKRAPKDIFSSITQESVEIFARASDGTWTLAVTDENGNIIDPANPPTIEIGQGLSFKVNWSIIDVLNKKLEPGDWFDFNLPSNFFKFTECAPTNLIGINEYSGLEEVIGTFEIIEAMGIEPAKIRVTLNQVAIDKTHISNGYIRVIGFAKAVKGKDEVIKIGEGEVGPIIIKPSDGERELDDYDTISKDGWQISNKDLITWGFRINYDVIKKVYNGELSSPEQKSNMIFIDELPLGISAGSASNIDISSPIYAATESGRMSANLVENGWNGISLDLFKKLDQNENETWAEFMVRVENFAAPSYGIFEDASDSRTKVIFNLGEMPGQFTSRNSLSEIYNIIDADSNLSNNQKQHTKAAYDRIFANSGNTGILGLIIQLQGLDVTDGTGEYKNIATLKWNNTDNQSSENIVRFQQVGGGATTGDPQSVTIKKYEEGTSNSIKGARFKLQVQQIGGTYSDFQPLDNGGVERETNNKGEVVFGKLPNGKYRVVETQAPLGYTDNITFLNDIDTFEITGHETGTIFITAYNPIELISINGVKTWDDNNDLEGKRPSEITINLFADGEKLEHKKVLESNQWAYSFENLQRYKDGKEIIYTITEETVENYESIIIGYNITNKYVHETIDIFGTKTWDDSNNSDGKRPKEIIVNLLADGKIVDSKTVTEGSQWTYRFEKLNRFNGSKEIIYTITENEVKDYETIISGYDIINKHIRETIDISGVKTWSDNNNKANKRPDSIVIKLFANGLEVENVIPSWIKEGNKWSYTYYDLPRYEKGKEITYVIKEEPVKDYTTTIDGFNITNTINKEPVPELPSTGERQNTGGYVLIGFGLMLISIDFIKKSKMVSKNK